jgi:hypothetical protein
MKRFLTIRRLSIMFIGLFALSLGGLFAWESYYKTPADKCAEKGQWWYPEERRCLTPIYLPDITRRAPGVSRAEASAEQNRALVEIEHRLADEKQARQAETDRQRAALAGR